MNDLADTLKFLDAHPGAQFFGGEEVVEAGRVCGLPVRLCNALRPGTVLIVAPNMVTPLPSLEPTTMPFHVNPAYGQKITNIGFLVSPVKSYPPAHRGEHFAHWRLTYNKRKFKRARRLWTRLVFRGTQEGDFEALIRAAQRAKARGLYSPTTYPQDIAVGLVNRMAKMADPEHWKEWSLRWGHTGKS